MEHPFQVPLSESEQLHSIKQNGFNPAHAKSTRYRPRNSTKSAPDWRATNQLHNPAAGADMKKSTLSPPAEDNDVITEIKSVSLPLRNPRHVPQSSSMDLPDFDDGNPLQLLQASYGSNSSLLDLETKSPGADVTPTAPQKAHERASVVAELLKTAKHCVLFTGEEIAFPDVPGYDTPNGIWTMRKSKRHAEMGKRLEDCIPRDIHMAIHELVDKEYIHHVISTNVDGLHIRSGIPPEQISEVQGNIYLEMCTQCGSGYYRTYDVTHHTDDNTSFTGRMCEDYQCFGKLKHTLVNGVTHPDKIDPETKRTAFDHILRADFVLLLGVPAEYFLPMYYNMMSTVQKQGGDIVVCGSKRSCVDDKAFVRVYGSPDVFIEHVMLHLHLDTVPYQAQGIEFTDLAPTKTARTFIDRSGEKKCGSCCSIQ